MNYLLLILKDYANQNKFYLIIYILFIILAYPLESILIPQLYSNFFSNINEKTKPMTYLKYMTYIFIALCIVNIAFSFVNYLETILVPSSSEHILNFIYKNTIKKYENKYEDIELGRLITRINQLPNVIRSFSSDICKWMLPQFITIVIINIYFLFINWILGTVSIGMFIIFLYMNYYLYNKCIVASIDRHRLFENNMGEIQDKISNLQSIYSAGKSSDEVNTYNQKTKVYISKVKDSLLCANKINIFYNTFNVLIFVILNSITIYLYYTHQISFVMVMAIFITIIYYSPCIYSIGGCMLDSIYNMGIINQLEDFSKSLYTTHIEKVEQIKEIHIQYGKIQIENVNYSYNGKANLFNNFNLTIHPGEKVALLGNSGNGKSTLIKLIMGYYDFEGKISIDQHDVRNVSINELRKKISYVNQNNKLFNTTILKNIQYGNTLSRKDIENMLYELDIENIFKNLPDGLDTNVGIQGDSLSGGQKQMIHILRCIGKKNKIVILDEPTASIDKYNKVSIIKAIYRLSINSTMIIITHDESILDFVDRKVYLDAGKIIKDEYKVDKHEE